MNTIKYKLSTESLADNRIYQGKFSIYGRNYGAALTIIEATFKQTGETDTSQLPPKICFNGFPEVQLNEGEVWNAKNKILKFKGKHVSRMIWGTVKPAGEWNIDIQVDLSDNSDWLSEE